MDVDGGPTNGMAPGQPERWVVPAAAFAGREFFRRAERVAAGAGHDGHPLILAGASEPTDRYAYRCQRCDTTLIEVTVDRAAAPT